MTPFSLHNDNIITSLMSQSVPPTTWHRFVAGMNAQLRLLCRGCLRVKFRPVLQWLETLANPALRIYGVHVNLAWFQATTDGYCHYGLLIYAIEEDRDSLSLGCPDGAPENEHPPSTAICIYRMDETSYKTHLGQTQSSTECSSRRKICGGILDGSSLKVLEEKRDLFFILSFLIHNTKPVGHKG